MTPLSNNPVSSPLHVLLQVTLKHRNSTASEGSHNGPLGNNRGDVFTPHTELAEEVYTKIGPSKISSHLFQYAP